MSVSGQHGRPERPSAREQALVAREQVPATREELEEDEAYATADDDVQPWDLTDRERRIYEVGFLSGHLIRQGEVDAAWNAFKRADSDADRFYRNAFDHEYHDCAVHSYSGPYAGARTRLGDDDFR